MGDEVTLDERNLQSYLVKILQPDDQSVNGTGFFCHPDGYVLTCYHVIKPYIKAERTAVTVNYQDESFQAQILKDYCNVDADIAVLKLAEQEKKWPYLDLGVHKRWNLEDRVSSFGYPQDSSFRETGIGITAKLVSATKDEKTEVVQIADDTLENIARGFSGAPVLHQRTKKVIGLVYSEYTSRQSFLVPLDSLYRQWPKLRNFHDVFEKIRSKLADEAQEKLNEKTKDTPFVPLRLECGRIPEKPTTGENEEPKEKEWTHGRKWEDFDLENLLPISKPFILSSSVGTGKTTFLYWLVLKLVEKTDVAPIFMTCSDFESLNPNNWDDLEKQLVSHYEGNFSKVDLEDFFNMYFENHKIIFLCDGLDQIRSNDYSVVADRMFKICSPNPVLISSRPSSVISLETKPEILFLRLKPFSLPEQRQYFGEDFERAGRLSQLAPDLVRIPMLAYMVKMLIKEGKAEGVSKRTELYKRFIDYIIYKHEPHIPISSDDPDITEDIKETLKQISFEALSLKEPQIQKVSRDLYTKGDFKTDVSKLTAFGLVNRVLERGDLTQSCLFFTHQSFQEFLAAQYINEHEELVVDVLNEMWAPKWKEAIKFLAGMRGQEIVEKILNKDNVIHAGLFLATECVHEVREIKRKVKEKLWTQIRQVVHTEPFRVPSVHSLKYLKDVKTLTSLLKDEDYDVREEAFNALSHVKEDLDNETIRVIMSLLRTSVSHSKIEQAIHAFTELHEWANEQDIHRIAELAMNELCENPDTKAIYALTVVKDRLDEQDIHEIVSLATYPLHEELLEGEDAPYEFLGQFQTVAMNALAAVEDRIDVQDIHEIVEQLEDKDWVLREMAIESLVVLEHRLDEKDVRNTANGLWHEDSSVREDTIRLLARLKDRIDEQHIRKIIELLEDEVPRVRMRALEALIDFGDRIDEKDIFKIICMLGDENRNVRNAAIRILADLKDRVDEQGFRKIVELLSYMPNAAIVPLFEFSDRLDKKDILKIAELLESDFSSLREAALDLLTMLADRIDDTIICKIVDLVRHEDYKHVSFASEDEAMIKALRALKDRINEKDICKITCMLGDEESYIRKTAVKALGALNERVNNKDIHVVAELLDDEDSQVLAATIDFLTVVKNRVKGEYIHKIVEMLGDKSFSVGKSAIKGLITFKDRVDDVDIRKIVDLMRNEDYLVRVNAREALVAFKDRIDDNVIRKIAMLLDDEEADVRETAVKALGALKERVDDNVIRKIAMLLDDEEVDVRKSAMSCLVAFRDRLCVEDIRKIAGMLGDEDRNIRKAAIRVLADFSDMVDKKGIRKIAKMLGDKDEDRDVRSEAMKALPAFKDRAAKEGIHTIIEVLEDEDRIPGEAAVTALVEFKAWVDEEHIHKIVALMENKDRMLRGRAYNTLKLFYESGIPLP